MNKLTPLCRCMSCLASARSADVRCWRALSARNFRPSVLGLAAGVVIAAAPSGLGADYAGWAVGHSSGGYGTIIHTVNSGATWERQGAGAIPNADMFGVATVNSSTAWVVGTVADGYSTIYRTTDAGQSWARMGSALSLPNENLYKVNAVSAQNVWAVGQGTIVNTSDGGTTWANHTPAGYDATMFQGIFSPDGVNVWATGEAKDGYATVLKSTDAGQNWVRQSDGFSPNVDHILGVAAVDANNAWAVGGMGNYIFKTKDGGTKWDLMDGHDGITRDANEVAVVSIDDVWVAEDSSVKWTHDGGLTWDSYNTGDFTMGIAVADKTNAWAVSQSFMGQGLIYHTGDGGANWEQQTVAGWTPGGLLTVSFASQPVPEPSGIALMVIVIGAGAGFVARRRRAGE